MVHQVQSSPLTAEGGVPSKGKSLTIIIRLSEKILPSSKKATIDWIPKCANLTYFTFKYKSYAQEKHYQVQPLKFSDNLVAKDINLSNSSLSHLTEKDEVWHREPAALVQCVLYQPICISQATLQGKLCLDIPKPEEHLCSMILVIKEKQQLVTAKWKGEKSNFCDWTESL